MSVVTGEEAEEEEDEYHSEDEDVPSSTTVASDSTLESEAPKNNAGSASAVAPATSTPGPVKSPGNDDTNLRQTTKPESMTIAQPTKLPPRRETALMGQLREHSGRLNKSLADGLHFYYDNMEKKLVATGDMFKRSLKATQDIRANLNSANEDLTRLMAQTTISTTTLDSVKRIRRRSPPGSPQPTVRPDASATP